MNAFLIILFFLAFPLLLIYLCEKFIVLNKIGAVLLAYAAGLILGNLGLIQQVEGYTAVQDNLNGVSILLAIPLLLFSVDIRNWLNVAGKASLALLVLLLSVVVSVIAGFFLFGDHINNSWKVGGMLMGVYSGGTPNLAAVQSMLEAAPEEFITINTLDIFVSATYLLFLMTAGKYFFRKFLPNYDYANNALGKLQYEDETKYKGIFEKDNFIPLLKAIGVAIAIVGVSLAISHAMFNETSMLVIILSITTLAIVASLFKWVNSINYTFQTGMYFIVVFCLVVASMADISQLGEIAFNIFKYICFVVFGSLLLKTIFSKIFKIDADTLIVASTALICSPPFVPVMAGVLKNKQIIVTGLTIGIIGYAVGNYLGVTIAFLLKMF